MASPIERFERWRRRQGARTAKLALKVLEELVPLYEINGFERFDDYAGGDLSVELRCHPLAGRSSRAQSIFLAARAANVSRSLLPATVFEPRPFLRLMAASA